MRAFNRFLHIWSEQHPWLALVPATVVYRVWGMGFNHKACSTIKLNPDEYLGESMGTGLNPLAYRSCNYIHGVIG
jgi:hypothetical protein